LDEGLDPDPESLIHMRKATQKISNPEIRVEIVSNPFLGKYSKLNQSSQFSLMVCSLS